MKTNYTDAEMVQLSNALKHESDSNAVRAAQQIVSNHEGHTLKEDGIAVGSKTHHTDDALKRIVKSKSLIAPQ